MTDVRDVFFLTHDPIDVSGLLRRHGVVDAQVGATVTFLGTTKDTFKGMLLYSYSFGGCTSLECPSWYGTRSDGNAAGV